MKNPYQRLSRFFAFCQVRGLGVPVRVLRNKRHHAVGNLAQFSAALKTGLCGAE
jgi:hypothetical protein